MIHMTGHKCVNRQHSESTSTGVCKNCAEDKLEFEKEMVVEMWNRKFEEVKREIDARLVRFATSYPQSKYPQTWTDELIESLGKH
jgi:hypothetical protein